MVFVLAGCSDFESPSPDQCLRAEIFKSCMGSLPEGPKSTQYNDWDEVVGSCETTAYYQSLRIQANIKPECRAK